MFSLTKVEQTANLLFRASCNNKHISVHHINDNKNHAEREASSGAAKMHFLMSAGAAGDEFSINIR